MEIFPGTFENLAKMARMPSLPVSTTKPISNNMSDNHVQVRLRNIYTPHITRTTSSVQQRKPYTDSDSDSTPRPTSYRSYSAKLRSSNNQRLFYREPFPSGPPQVPEPAPEEEVTVEDRVSLERLRNKQWQREKLRAVREQSYDPRKEKRRRVFTRRERDQMRAKQQLYGDSVPLAVMSDIENRFPDEDRFSDSRWHRSLSGYSTPASSCDEMKLGRNMRAAPRHIIESRHRTAPKMRHKDLIEMLNRQQQLLQLQQDQRRKFLEEQKVREQAKILVNEALLTEEEKSRRSFREGNVTPTNQKANSVEQQMQSGASTPAIQQLITQGRVSSTRSLVASEPSHRSEGDFFENDRFSGTGLYNNNNSHDASQKDANEDEANKEQLTQAIRDELNRLSAS